MNIPEGVTEIGDYAFYSCSSLTGITIPPGVKWIGNNAFYGCSSLTELTLPDNILTIGREAFECCFSLSIKYKGKTYQRFQPDDEKYKHCYYAFQKLYDDINNP